MSSDTKKHSTRSRRSAATLNSHGNGPKVNQNLGGSLLARKDARARRKANRLAALPKGRVKRLIYRLEPRRLMAYWFSRDGLIMGLKITGIGIVFLFVLSIGLFAYFRKDLPKLVDISGGNLGGSITYYDSTGQTVLWQDYSAVKRVAIPGNQMSKYVREATVAIEDKNFYHEGAFSVSGIVRAGLHDLFGGSGLQGASTITEQVVKLNENWDGNRSVSTKIKEIILAVDLGREYSKNTILTGYLNVAPYGGVDYGVEAAARDYFGEDASQLTLAQSAMLAAIPQAPTYYSPFSSPQYNPAASTDEFGQQALLARKNYILNQMAIQGYITQAQANAAIKVNVLSEVHQLQTKYAGIQAPYFVLAAKQQLENEYGAATVNRGGWKVITTLNTSLQADAEKDVAANIANVAAVNGDEEAMVAENVQTGQVVAEVGGENFSNPIDGQINYANTNISPGSSMKPFLYAELIQNNTDVGAGSVLYDTQGPIPGYPCTNKARPTLTSNGGNCLWDDNFIYPGPETLRYALAGSRNVPAVKASYEVVPNDKSPDYTASVNKWIDTANQAIGTKNAYACYQPGVNVETATAAQMTQCYGSAALGSGDIAIDQEVNGDVTLARLGSEIPQTYILKIINSSGKVVYNWTQPKGTQVYNPDSAYIVNNMLDDPRATYLLPYQKFQNYNGWDIAVKTGTENQNYNGLMTAWSTQYAVIGFAGYHTLAQPLIEGHFEDITEPLTRTWMEQALNALHTKPINWVQPSDVKVLPAFVQRISPGYGAEVPGPSTDLYPAWYKGKAAYGSATQSETIDKISGNLATNCTPALAKEVMTASNNNTFSIDIFWPLGQTTTSSLPTSTDNVHSCSDPPIQAPTITVDDSSTNGTVTDPTNSNYYTCPSGSCAIQVVMGSSPPPAQTEGTSPYNRYPITVSLLVNGQVYGTPQTISYNSPYSVNPFTYIPTSTPAKISVQVVDNALYSATSQSYTVVASPANNPTKTTGNGSSTNTGSNTGSSPS